MPLTDACRRDRGVIEKLAYSPRELAGLLVVKVMSAPLELPEDDPFHRLRECPTMLSRYDRVTISPADCDGRELGELVSPFEERTALATPIDHVPHGSRERTRRPGGPVHCTELLDILLGESSATATQCNSGS